MDFAGMNYFAIVIAAFVGAAIGAAWYGTLTKPWLAAAGMTRDEFKSVGKQGHLIAFAAQFPMVWVLAGLIGHLGAGQVTLANGIISALFVWFGFVLTTISVNHRFLGRPWKLTTIDTGYWLVSLCVQGAIIGWMGV